VRRAALATTAVMMTATLTGGWAVQSAEIRPEGGKAAEAGKPAETAAEARGAEQAARRAAEKGVDWKDCGDDSPLQCGIVTVPVDYADPGGRTIGIAVDRYPSQGTKEQRQGSLLLNPGGPGAPGVGVPLSMARNSVWQKVTRAYDLIGFDPRGVGFSAPVSCTDPQQHAKVPKPDPVPHGEADKQRAHERARAYAQGCKERTGDLLGHIDTPNTARDMDVIRAALGERKLNYLGYSYGTYLGAVYGTLFPDRVRRMVLDSVVNPSNVWYENHRAQVPAFERRFGEWKRWVARHDDAFHLGSTADEVGERLEKLMSQARREPIGGKAGPHELTQMFMMTMYSDGAWVPNTTVWSEYEAGRPDGLVEKATGGPMSENFTAAYTAVNCNDAPWPRDPERWDRDAERQHERHPFLAWFSQRMNLPCESWPERSRTPVDVRTREGLPPTLIVQNEGDAATPLEGAAELHRRFRDSGMITVRGEGQHIASDTPNPCVNDRVDGYLLRGELDGHDASCAAPPQPEPPAGSGSAASESAASGSAASRVAGPGPSATGR
jgi:pimeloyl-ACP methyl ester carboxylesterase